MICTGFMNAMSYRAVADKYGPSEMAIRKIVDYINKTGNSMSKSAVQRYSSNLMESLHTLRIAQENFSAYISISIQITVQMKLALKN